MPTRPLPLTRRAHTLAFRGLVTQLKADPTLRRTVALWRTWDGDEDDAAPFACDAGVTVRLTPENAEWSRLTIVGGRDVSLDVGLELYVPEGGADDSANLWDAIESLIASESFLTAMQGYGTWDVDVLAPATATADNAGLLTLSSAKIRLFIST